MSVFRTKGFYSFLFPQRGSGKVENFTTHSRRRKDGGTPPGPLSIFHFFSRREEEYLGPGNEHTDPPIPIGLHLP